MKGPKKNDVVGLEFGQDVGLGIGMEVVVGGDLGGWADGDGCDDDQAHPEWKFHFIFEGNNIIKMLWSRRYRKFYTHQYRRNLKHPNPTYPKTH